MTACHHHAKSRDDSRVTSRAMSFAGKRRDRAAARGAMAQTRTLWACDPTCDSPLAPRGDRKWEVDSMAEVGGT